MDMETLSNNVAKNIESLLKEKGLNPSGVAKSGGMGHTAIRDIITRKTKHPTYATLVKIAEIAGVDISRITVGPHFTAMTQDDLESISVMFQLKPEERKFVLNIANAQIAARDRSR